MRESTAKLRCTCTAVGVSPGDAFVPIEMVHIHFYQANCLFRKDGKEVFTVQRGSAAEFFYKERHPPPAPVINMLFPLNFQTVANNIMNRQPGLPRWSCPVCPWVK